MQAMPPRYLGWGFATKRHATQNTSILSLVFRCFFFEVKPLYKDLHTWCCLAFLCGLRWTCRPNGHMSKWCSRCVTVMFNVPWEWCKNETHQGSRGDCGGWQLSISFGLREMSSNWKSRWGHTNTAISINKYQYTCFFNFGKLKTRLWITMFSAVRLGPRKLFFVRSGSALLLLRGFQGKIGCSP